MAKVLVLGLGNLGTQLSRRFAQVGADVLLLSSRNIEASALADAAFALICVKDDAIAAVAAEVHRLAPQLPLVHSSGATPSAVLSSYSVPYGVFYPLQTFSKSQAQAQWQGVPLCYNANSPALESQLSHWAQAISGNPLRLEDSQREALHVCAVLVNNFTNALYGMADEICRHQHIDFRLLMPLMRETLSKLDALSPQEAQTGPAKRHDRLTIERHLAFLADNHPQFSEIYRLMSDRIEALD